MIDQTLLSTIYNLFYAIVAASCIIILVSCWMSNTGSVNALISGYFGLSISLTFLLLLKFTSYNTNYLGSMIILSLTPLLLVMFVSIYSLVLLMMNKDSISNGYVTTQFSSLMTMSTIMTIVQMVMIFRDKLQIATQTINTKNVSIINLIGVLNIIVVITLGITLSKYTTQG